jgi:glycosyltransferase involved in cell wall biosynthesis
MTEKTENPMLSIIVPVMNEAENVTLLAGEIEQALRGTPWSWECLWVDDGSTDQTVARLQDIVRENPQHRLIEHVRNFGQSAAMTTGFRHAHGEIFVTLDGDGQNDPASIPDLIHCLINENADMVNGWRQKRQDNLIRKLSSRIANGFRNGLTREQVRDVGCALRAFRRECAGQVPVFKGMHRFFPTLVRMAGYTKILERPVNHRPRERGKTKYGINNRLWVGIVDVLAVRWMLSRMVYPQAKKETSCAE